MTRTKRSSGSADGSPKVATQSMFDDFLPHLIARLAYQLNNDLVEKLRREGINVTRWRILAVLAMGDGITINEIIDRAMMQQSALSRALMNMEKEDYVRRVLRRDDARYVEVFLTDKGRALFNSLNIVVRRRQRRLLKGFSPQELTLAFAMIRRMSLVLRFPKPAFSVRRRIISRIAKSARFPLDGVSALELAGAAWLLLKTGALVALMAWTRAVLPRRRLAERTQATALWLAPVSLAALVAAAAWTWWSPARAAQLLVSGALVAGVTLVAFALVHRFRHGILSSAGDARVSPFL